MKYICLVYVDESHVHNLSKNDQEDLSKESLAYCKGLRQSGHFIAAELLEAVRSATTVRIRAGQATVTDGPFAESKEQLGCFYLIDARDLNDALRIAARIPAARFGVVEVRPLKRTESV